MFAMTRQVEVIHRWVEGPDVLTWFELRTATAGPLAIVNWSHVEDGRITRIRVTFDPRTMVASDHRCYRWTHGDVRIDAWCQRPRRVLDPCHPWT